MAASNKTDQGTRLLSDFDGTMTPHDFYKPVIESLLPANTHSITGTNYRAGSIEFWQRLVV